MTAWFFFGALQLFPFVVEAIAQLTININLHANAVVVLKIVINHCTTVSHQLKMTFVVFSSISVSQGLLAFLRFFRNVNKANIFLQINRLKQCLPSVNDYRVTSRFWCRTQSIDNAKLRIFTKFCENFRVAKNAHHANTLARTPAQRNEQKMPW